MTSRAFLVIVVAEAKAGKRPRIFYARVYAMDRREASMRAWNRKLLPSLRRAGYTWANERVVRL